MVFDWCEFQNDFDFLPKLENPVLALHTRRKTMPLEDINDYIVVDVGSEHMLFSLYQCSFYDTKTKTLRERWTVFYPNDPNNLKGQYVYLGAFEFLYRLDEEWHFVGSYFKRALFERENQQMALDVWRFEQKSINRLDQAFHKPGNEVPMKLLQTPIIEVFNSGSLSTSRSKYLNEFAIDVTFQPMTNEQILREPILPINDLKDCHSMKIKLFKRQALFALQCDSTYVERIDIFKDYWFVFVWVGLDREYPDMFDEENYTERGYFGYVSTIVIEYKRYLNGEFQYRRVGQTTAHSPCDYSTDIDIRFIPLISEVFLNFKELLNSEEFPVMAMELLGLKEQNFMNPTERSNRRCNLLERLERV